MVTKKRTAKKAAPRRRRATVAAAPRRRAKKSGVTAIPGACATVGLVAVNAKNIANAIKAIGNNGQAKPSEMIARVVPGNSKWVTETYAKFISKDQIITDAVAIGGGYLAGYVLKKYAPGIIKTPMAKIAKKIPKVIE